MNKLSAHPRTYKKMRRLAKFSGLLVAVARLLLPALASAQPNPDVTDLLRRAETALLAKRPLEALLLWRAAWAKSPSYVSACNIGRAELLYGSAREAAEFLEICKRIYPKPKKPDEQRRRDSFLDDLTTARSRVASLHVTTSESGVKLRIDDRGFGPTPLPGAIFIEPGTHRISATRGGFESIDLAITLKAGEERTLPITLRKSKPLQGPPALAEKSATPATHRGPSKHFIVGGAALSVAQAGLGAGLLIARAVAEGDALGLRQDVRADFGLDCAETGAYGACADYLAAQRNRATMQSFATASFIGAGVTALATVVYAIFPRSSRAPKMGQGPGVAISF